MTENNERACWSCRMRVAGRDGLCWPFCPEQVETLEAFAEIRRYRLTAYGCLFPHKPEGVEA